MKIKLLFLIFILIFTACEKKKSINIAVNEWIGYAPLFYANEKGWLKQDDIKIIRTVSLGESVNLYKNGLVNGFTSTQYEYLPLKKEVTPIILLDKSYGGDMILSNKTINELKKYSKIDTYLEIDSVNYLLLKYFSNKYNIPLTKFNFINQDQQQLSKKSFDLSKPTIIITYIPYDLVFKKKGFHVISSTLDDDLLVIDALFIDKYLVNKNRFKHLKKKIDLAIKEIKQHPKQVYNVIQKYYPNYSYEDFEQGLYYIKWINNKTYINKLKSIDFETKDLIYEN